MVDAFSLKLQRDNRKNALAVEPAKGKTGEKGCIFTALWRWNNHILEQSQSILPWYNNVGSVIICGCFIFTVSPYCGGETATYSDRAFSYCFYIVMMPIGKALSEYMVVLFQQYTENICFFSKFSAGGFCDWGILLVISLEFQGNKASTVF